MHFSRMHTACLHVVSWGVDVLTWSWGGRGRCSDLVRGEGSRCSDLVPGRGGRCSDLVLGGGGRCSDLVLGREGVDVLNWSQGEREVVDHWCCPPTPLFSDRMTNTCENITFTRFATRTVKTHNVAIFMTQFLSHF